jgi:hypothetical protein
MRREPVTLGATPPAANNSAGALIYVVALLSPTNYKPSASWLNRVAARVAHTNS